MTRLKTKRKQQTKSSDTETTKLIRKTRQATRKRHTAEEKIRIVMEAVRGEEPASAICRREGIHSNMYYRWLKSFMEAGKERLKGEEPRGATRSEVKQLKLENQRLKELVAELSVENMVLKKVCFDSAEQAHEIRTDFGKREDRDRATGEQVATECQRDAGRVRSSPFHVLFVAAS